MTLVLTGPPATWKPQLEAADLQNVKRGVEYGSLTGVAMTRFSDGSALYVVDTQAGNRQVVLPRAADGAGQEHIVKRISGGANTCVVSSDGGALDGTASYSIATQYTVGRFMSDGQNWWTV